MYTRVCARTAAVVVDDYYYYYIIYVHFISFFEVRVNAVRVSVSDHVHRSLERDGFFFFGEEPFYV